MSTSESGRSTGAVTLDQIVALNDEMAALVRAGIPLERGLIEAGRDIGGRLGRIVADLGGRLDRGEPLPDALGGSRDGLPGVYRAIVEAGIRSGRLSKALEGMATIARGHAEARRAVGLSLLYPLLVVALAYSLFLGFVLRIAPAFVVGFEGLGLAPVRPLIAMAKAGESVRYWGPILPVLILILLIRWVISGRAGSLDGGPGVRLAARVPLIGRMVADFRSANFAELLGLLIGHRVPLDEAVRLAAGVSGDRGFARAAESFAGRLRQGDQVAPGAPVRSSAFPPLLLWMLTAGHRQGNLPDALHHAALTYRKRAEIRANALQAALPTVLLIGIGAVAVLLYGLVLFLPLTALWNELAVPTN